MTRDEAVDMIQFELGNRSDLEQQIIDRLQQGQRLLEHGRSLPYFLLEEDQTLSVASGSGDTALPTGFLREKDGEGLRYYDSTEEEYTFLEKLILEQGLDRFAGSDAGVPAAYAIRKTELTIWPERDTSYSLTWSYYKSGTSLATNVSDNAWLVYAPEVLIGLTGMRIARILKNQNAVELFKELYHGAWSNAFAESILREDEGDPILMGGRL